MVSLEEEYSKIDIHLFKDVTYKFELPCLKEYSEYSIKEHIIHLANSIFDVKPLSKYLRIDYYSYDESNIYLRFESNLPFCDEGPFESQEACNNSDKCILECFKNALYEEDCTLQHYLETKDDLKCITGCGKVTIDKSERYLDDKESLFCYKHIARKYVDKYVDKCEGKSEDKITEMLDDYKIKCYDKLKIEYREFLEFLKNPLPSEIKLLDIDGKPVTLALIKIIN